MFPTIEHGKGIVIEVIGDVLTAEEEIRSLTQVKLLRSKTFTIQEKVEL